MVGEGQDSECGSSWRPVDTDPYSNALGTMYLRRVSVCDGSP